VFVVTGSSFTPNSVVVIRITDEQLAQTQLAETADDGGSFVARSNLTCATGVTLTVTAFEDASPSDTFANSVVTACL
jgi:fibronectin type 3 domain-containing protein